MITILAACSTNRVIGRDNKLPWYLPEDLKRFKILTIGKVVLMGRKTYESIGKPLPNRTNVVLTRDKTFNPKGVLVYNNLEEVIPIFHDIIVIGGGEIFNQMVKMADIIELTLIDREFDGDSFFPKIDMNQWEEEKNESFKNDNSKFSATCIVDGDFTYHFIRYKRR